MRQDLREMNLHSPRGSPRRHPPYTFASYSKPRRRNRLKWTLLSMYAASFPFVVFLIFNWSGSTEINKRDTLEMLSQKTQLERLSSIDFNQATEKPYGTFSIPSNAKLKVRNNEILSDTTPTKETVLPADRSAKPETNDEQISADRTEPASATFERSVNNNKFAQSMKQRTDDFAEDLIIFTPQRDLNDGENRSLDKREEKEGRKLLETFFRQIVPEERFGLLNVHIWEEICGNQVGQLRHSPFFPAFPSKRFAIAEFKSVFQGSNFGQRVFGFLHPNQSGLYQFAIISDDTSELWLSSDNNPKLARLITSVNANQATKMSPSLTQKTFPKYQAKVTPKIQLEKDQKYYIEALHKQETGLSYLEVLWKIPNTYSLETIGSKHLSLYTDDRHLQDREKLRNFLNSPRDLPSHVRNKRLVEVDKLYYYNLSFVDWQNFSSSLPFCSYAPSYLTRKNQAIDPSAHLTLTYSADDGSQTREETDDDNLADRDVVEYVVKSFVNAMKEKHGSLYSFHKIVKVEQKPDVVKGDRYLLELELVSALETRRLVRLSEYVYQRKALGSLCIPRGLQWRRDAIVHLIVTVKNQAHWFYSFIKTVSEAYRKSGDERFKVVVVDFESQDADVEEMLNKSSIRHRYTLVKKAGSYHVTQGLIDAVNTITDPHSIIVLCDIHLDVPPTIMDSIRKHTVEQRTVFAPIAKRLQCGASPQHPRGRWNNLEYIMAATYLKDWNRLINANGHLSKGSRVKVSIWAQAQSVGLEVERVRLPGLYHYYHVDKQRR